MRRRGDRAGVHRHIGNARRLGGDDARAYRAAIREHPNAKAVYAVSCDYFGLLCDLPAIAALAHASGMLLLCDEAHGAYL